MKPEIRFAIEAMPEETPIRGNAVDSGDPAFDRETEEKIAKELESNPWAWCTVRVEASIKIDGEEFVGNDFLGCSSYESEEDFKRGGYFEDMKERAKEDLIEQIRFWIGRGKVAESALADLE